MLAPLDMGAALLPELDHLFRDKLSEMPGNQENRKLDDKDQILLSE